MKKNVILCGFMGCGKSTIGKLLALKLNAKFIDIDSFIEKRENRSISDIFQTDGEAYFRRLETDVLQEFNTKSDLVIATGGGALLKEENVQICKTNSTILFLDVPVKIIQKRLKEDTVRPLLQVENRNTVIEELYEKRLPLYQKAADRIIDANGSAQQTVERILSALMSYEL